MSANHGEMTVESAAAFESAARCFTDLMETIPPTALDGPGLGGWNLRSLVGHTSWSLTTVIIYLEQPAAAVDIPSVVAYYSWVVQHLGADLARGSLR